MFEASKEVKAAEAVIKQARKDSKALAHVGVTAKELTAAQQSLAAALKDKRAWAKLVLSYRDAAAGWKAAKVEAKGLISTIKRSVSMALSHDLGEANELKVAAGIGEKTAFTAASLGARCRTLADVCGDPRWKKVLARRGVSSAQVKRLGELSALLAEAERPPGGSELPRQLADLMRGVDYLRDAALTAFGPSSAKYSAYRPPAPAKHHGKAPPAPLAAG